jgi:sec-independent protein translocase protein TatA
MNFFGIGLPEMAVIAAIGLLVFGPKRLPELGKTLGRTLRGFQSASQEFEKEFRTAISETAISSESETTTGGLASASYEVSANENEVVSADVTSSPPLPAAPATAAAPAGSGPSLADSPAAGPS